MTYCIHCTLTYQLNNAMSLNIKFALLVKYALLNKIVKRQIVILVSDLNKLLSAFFVHEGMPDTRSSEPR